MVVRPVPLALIGCALLLAQAQAAEEPPAAAPRSEPKAAVAETPSESGASRVPELDLLTF